jgi:ABC-type nitrate/sulfonate/bicarbonate transport system ATPase subunit
MIMSNHPAPAPPGNFLQCATVSKVFDARGGKVEALRRIELQFGLGEFVCFLGASGCGKSTLLSIIGGLETPTEGRVLLRGSPINGPSRDLSFVFQDHGLFPWMTVERNIAFALRAAGVGRAQRLAAAREYLGLVGLQGFGARFPHELSGGMKQRVGIARALTTEPKLLLMDEPFGALDAQTRANLQQEVLRIWAGRQATVLFVTHSIDEALILADRIVVFHPRPGRVRADLRVELPRPRDIHAPEFGIMARELEALLHSPA